MSARRDIEAWAEAIRAGSRRDLAQAITLVESSRPEDRAIAVALLGQLRGSMGGAHRIGISGPPGVGKSTFLEALGLQLVDMGYRVAVLAVDPSSSRTGGSILGDKTRMSELARRPEAYIRPSPSGGDLGGVAARTGEALLLCEAAGFDLVLIETVGVGQSEVAVSGMVDTFALLLSPGGGDELQGVKRGIMELADVVVITKADGDLAAAAQRAVGEHRSAMHLMRRRIPSWEPQVASVSSLNGDGMTELWSMLVAHREELGLSGEGQALRARQAVDAYWREVERGLLQRLRQGTGLAMSVDRLAGEVARGLRLPAEGAFAALAGLADPDGLP